MTIAGMTRVMRLAGVTFEGASSRAHVAAIVMTSMVHVLDQEGQLFRYPDGHPVRVHRFRLAPPPAEPFCFRVATPEDIREEILRDYWGGGWEA